MLIERFLRVSPRIVCLALLLSVCTGIPGCSHVKARVATPLSSLVVPVEPVKPAPEVVKEVKEPRGPEILSRTAWSSAAPIYSRLEPMGKITRITIHHEGMDVQEECSMAAVKEELRLIQRSHEERMHAGDIGYHFIIDYSGRIWEGRSLKYQGAHAGGDANRNNIGVVLMGNFEIQRPTRSQMNSLGNLVQFLMSAYDIEPNMIYTHREIKRKYGMGETDCPGKYLQQNVDLMRKVLADARME